MMTTVGFGLLARRNGLAWRNGSAMLTADRDVKCDVSFFGASSEGAKQGGWDGMLDYRL